MVRERPGQGVGAVQIGNSHIHDTRGMRGSGTGQGAGIHDHHIRCRRTAEGDAHDTAEVAARHGHRSPTGYRAVLRRNVRNGRRIVVGIAVRKCIGTEVVDHLNIHVARRVGGNGAGDRRGIHHRYPRGSRASEGHGRGPDLGEVDAYKDLDHAKVAKKTLTKMRTTLGEAHKEAKADALAYGRRCDAEKNRLLELIAEIEDPITLQLDAIKSAEAREEQQRIDKIMEGIEQIQAFALDRHDLTFDQLNERLDTLLALKVDPDFYAELTQDAENAKEVSESKLRIALMNEEARLKEVEAQEQTRKENAELKEKLAKSEAENAERDAAAKKVADEAAAEQKIKDDARQAELDKQAEEQAAAQKILDDEAAAKVQQEADDQAAALAAIQAPDKEKLTLFAQAIDHLVGVKPTLQSDAGNAIMLDAVSSLLQVKSYIETKREEL